MVRRALMRGRLDTTKLASQVRNGQRWVVERVDTREERPRSSGAAQTGMSLVF
ncbi:hypothetical protein MAHJHV60_46900 [Mycobacterium avium subsp. hominissuis]